ncbi:hypothetical protein [Chondromyces crocatus]|uniref:Uncharacterized protein n=1 Tax=Chondromyces crocatus TaxID=52 RepID=A0A0K1EBS9_CHOCO|nr:hypothetical protein [Chondromyces crocatus]AKT38309.1 uncharacterized protein CMC5_024540 [Chondromyces crocatus]
MTRKLQLLCDANPMAYGSSSALLSILDHLDADATALVRDVSAELLGTDPAVRRTLAVDVKDPHAVAAAIADEPLDAALVVSNLTNVEVYLRRGLPVFFVDILYWYTARKDHLVWSAAERTYAQAFPGVKERLQTLPAASRPHLVGPLIRSLPPRSQAPRGTVVNLGGVRSRFIHPDDAPMFLEGIGHLLREAEPLLPEGPVLVAAGADACHVLERVLPPRAKAVCLPQHAYLQALADAALFLTAPGLNAIFEALALDLPLVFLPPQNATQVLQLARYEDAALVPPGLNLPALDPSLPLPHQIDDEGAYTHGVLDSLRRLTRSDGSLRVMAQHLLHQIHTVSARTDARLAFRTALGPKGGAQIADDIHRWWRQRPAHD